MTLALDQVYGTVLRVPPRFREAWEAFDVGGHYHGSQAEFFVTIDS